MASYISAAITSRPFFFGKPVDCAFGFRPPELHFSPVTLAPNETAKKAVLQGKLILNAIAECTGKLSSVFAVIRHAEDLLPEGPLSDLIRNGTKLSDGLESVNDAQGLVNGDVLEEITKGKTAMLKARVCLAVANLISTGFFLQYINVIQFRAVWITSDLVPSWALSVINYISNHSATATVSANLPESWRSGVTDRAGRLMALPLSKFLESVAGIGYTAFFGFATWQAYKDKNNIHMAAFGAKFVNTAVSVIGVENQYVKATLAITCMATGFYKNYCNVNG